MTKKETARLYAQALEKLYPDTKCGLDYSGDGYRLIVAAILSAQCTDVRVNATCVTLFGKWGDMESLASAPVEEIAEVIRPVGLFNTKAKNIKSCCEILVKDFGSRVPEDMESLLSLPGVGRKIANLVRGDLYGLGGIVADTHMIRISNRLGLTEKPDALLTERVLTELVETQRQSDFCHRSVDFGRDICCARAPKCNICPATGICRYNNKETEGK